MLAAGAALAEEAGTEPSADVLGRVAPGVLRVIAENCTGSEAARAGSGFSWPSPGRVVTDLHVVAGCGHIRVGYQQVDERPARVIHVLVSADLALLEVDGAPPVPALALAPEPPPVGAVVDVFGYALGQPTRDTHPLHVTFANQEAPLLSDALPDDVRAEIRKIGFPALQTQVLRLDGNLLPGHSGAPLIDADGRVVAVGSGGLERGAVGVGWAVRAQYLPALLTSTDAMPASGTVGTTAFATAAPAGSAGDDRVRCGELTLVRRRITSFGAVAATAPDPNMLERLATDFVHVPLQSIADNKAEIWTEPGSGAGVLLPRSLPLAPQQHYCIIPSLVPEVRYLVRVVPLPARIGGADWDARWQEELRQSFSLIEQAVGGHAIGERQIRGLTLVQTSNGVRTLRRAFEGVDARGQPIRIYRSDAAGRGAYVLSAVIATEAQMPEEMPVRVRQAWARGVFAINLSGFPP